MSKHRQNLILARETKLSKVLCLMKQRDGRGLSAGPTDPEFEVLTTRLHTPPLPYRMLTAKPMEE